MNKKWGTNLFIKLREICENKDFDPAYWNFSVYLGLKDKQIKTTVADKNIKLPASLYSFYQATERVVIDCIMEAEGVVAFANTSTRLLDDIGHTQVKTRYRYEDFWYDKLSDERKATLSKLQIWDDLSYGNYVLFMSHPNGNETLYLYNNYLDKLEELCIGFEDYFLLIEYTKGMYLWQQYFLKEGDFFFTDNFMRDMTHFFPEDAEKVMELRAKYGLEMLEYTEEVKGGRKSYFDDLMKRLNEIEDVTIEEKGGNPPVHPGAVLKAESTLQQSIPDIIKHFYEVNDGFFVRWFTVLDGQKIEGEIRIVGLPKMFGGKPGGYTKYWDENVHCDFLWFENEVDELNEEEFAMRKSLKPFSNYNAEQIICLLFKGPNASPELYIKTPREVYLLPFGFDVYCEKMVEYLGVNGWEYYEYLLNQKSITSGQKDWMASFNQRWEILKEKLYG